MELMPSAHVDTFPRDSLPPAAQWPDLRFGPGVPPYPDRLNCGAELLDATVARWGPDRPAMRDKSGSVWSYGELRERVDRIAHTLTEDLGVVPGNRVLLRGPTTPLLAACWLAVAKAGAVAVTVPAAQRARELATICRIARVRHALCDARSAGELVKAAVPSLRMTPFGGGSPGDLLRLSAKKPPSYDAVATSADDVALIAFTSGTTGPPKGCLHFHRDVLAVADTFSAQVLRPRPDDVFGGSPPLGFTFGLGGLVVFPLRAGASTVLAEWSGPGQLLADVQRQRVSVLFTAPTAYRAMLERIGPYDTSSLRRCVSAGEHLPAALWHSWRAATGLSLINGIGATEMLHIFLAAADDTARPGTTGRPVPGFEARIVAAADDMSRPVPDGSPGLLAVRGPVGCRYLADERQTTYVRDGWNLTGDRYVRDAEGYFTFLGRADDMIVSGGHNIAGPEVEEALLRHPDVLEAAVTGRPDERRGELVVAHVVVRNGVPRSERTADDLREFTKKEIASYKCPREIVFLDALPRTPTGKLQRFRLRSGALQFPRD